MEAYREFEGFKTPEEAFERRGKLQGMRLGVQVISQLYAEKSDGNISEASRRNTDSRVSTGITIPVNPGDEDSESPAY